MKTKFPVDIKKLKFTAKTYAENGMTHMDHQYGPSIDAYIEKNHIEFYNQLILSEELTEFCLFYCFKAALYEQSYKHESSSKNLMDFQANELAYKDIYDEIANDSISYFKK